LALKTVSGDTTTNGQRKGVPNSWSGNSEAARTETCADMGNKQQFNAVNAEHQVHEIHNYTQSSQLTAAFPCISIQLSPNTIPQTVFTHFTQQHETMLYLHDYI